MDMKVQAVLFDLNEFIPKFSKEDIIALPDKQDKNSILLTEVDFEHVEFLTCRKQGEELITGAEQFFRLKETCRVRFGSTVFMGLWKDYQVRRENSVLEFLYRQKRIVSIDFFGDVILTPNGEFVFWLRRFAFDKTWHWLYGWMAEKYLNDRLSAVSILKT